MADPLSLLRKYNINKKDIIETDSQIFFGKLSWPKNVKTNYLITRPRNEASIKDYYTLECILFFLKNVHLFHPDYCKEAAAANIPAVRRPDRKQLLEYLNGEKEREECASIDKSAPLAIPTQAKRTYDDDSESVVKKPRIKETHMEKVCVPAASLVTPKEESATLDRLLAPKEEPLSVDRLDAPKEGLVTGDSRIVAVKEEPVTGDSRIVAVKEEPVTGDSRIVAVKEEPVTGDSRIVAVKEEPVTGDSRIVPVKEEPVTGDSRLVAVKKEPVPVNNRLVAPKEESVTMDNRLVTPKAEPVTGH